IQVASPVGPSPPKDIFDAHMFFYEENCQRIHNSVGFPVSRNDVSFIQLASVPPNPANLVSGNGLIAIAQASPNGFQLIPLPPDAPLFVRVYFFNTGDGRSRAIEPIILAAAESPSPTLWWSPLRTGGAFFAPLTTAFVKTDLILVCPTNTIQGGTGQTSGTA